MKTKRKWFSLKLASITLPPFFVISLFGLVMAEPGTINWMIYAGGVAFLIVLNVLCADLYERTETGGKSSE